MALTRAEAWRPRLRACVPARVREVLELDNAVPRREAAVRSALRTAQGRVVARTELPRATGLSDLSERRVDSVLVSLRRRLPAGAVDTVRGRGWAPVGDPLR